MPLTKHCPPSTSNDSEIVSPINAQILPHYLSGYDQTLSDFLINGFSFGFKIPYFGERKFRSSENLPSLKGKAEVLFDKIQKEIQARRVAGPFMSPPFPNIQVPLGLVPKKAPGEFRLIHHLSFYQFKHPKGDDCC